MKVEFSAGYIEKVGDDILKVVYENDVVVTFETILEISQIRKDLGLPVPYKALAVFGQNMSNFEENYKLFLAQNEDAAQLRVADAMVARSGLALEISHYKKFYKPVVPTEVFTEEHAAISWLKKQ